MKYINNQLYKIYIQIDIIKLIYLTIIIIIKKIKNNIINKNNLIILLN